SIGLPAAAGAPTAPPVMVVSAGAADRLLGASMAGLASGAAGRRVAVRVRVAETPAPARNVVAILPGSDAALRGTYVALGAHNDHIGSSRAPVDHDSLKAINAARRRIYVALDDDGDDVLTAEQQQRYAAQIAGLTVNVDSLRRLRPARPDSIANGADDDGSGSMALLEIAEQLATQSTRPRRSILFVWHTGEEKGLLGARWYAGHPTVARDSIVAQLNIDMIGRGGPAEERHGGPDYVGLIGAGRLSTELDSTAQRVNRAQPRPLAFDRSLDRDGHPENIYCRSDHYEYAKFGIPIAFFFTGLHGDYHQVTDEPQYIDYPHYTRITRYVRDLAVAVADQPARPVVDRPKPDPNGVCRQ
ncbi:MAG TPA: M20/M25/M40 family metallo-hydrolase, partial [Gemmatirosa sp.]|nr:M20/M25/M40 family metallo-hydrolase [Gemmatirosa sp.]